MKRLNQTGSHVLAVAFLVLALGVVGFAGYKVMNANTDTQPTPTSAKTTSAPAGIQTTADLNKTAQALDSSSDQVNGSLDDSTLNSSMNDML
jgi:hypothetical protein